MRYNIYMKTCTYCKIDLPLDSFAKKGNGKQSRCRRCQSILTKEHYRNNKQYYVDKAKSRNMAHRQAVLDFLADVLSSGCVDCGNADLRVLEFDHLGDKEHSISYMLSHHYSIQAIQQEISKCEIVCSNCHAIRTAERAGTWRHALVSPNATNVLKG